MPALPGLRLGLAAALAATALAPLPALAADTLLDYRDAGFVTGSPAHSAREQDAVRRAIAEDAPEAVTADYGKDFVLLGEKSGAFTGKGSRERVVLVQSKRPVAAEPFPDAPAPVLVVAGEGEAPSAFFRLPGEVQYQRLVEVADLDGDGRDEVLLESSFMNMGQLDMSVTAFALDPQSGEAHPLGEPHEVYADSCGNPAGEQFRRTGTVSADGKGGLAVEMHDAPCA